MTVEQLQFFLHILETKSINRSANELFVSQSTLSYQLKMLEKELGFPLFSRAPNGVAPTKEALVLAEGVRTGCTEITQAVRRARIVRMRENRIDLALCCPFSFGQVGRLIDLLRADFPSYNISVSDCVDDRSAQSLSDGKADIAVLYKEQAAQIDSVIYSELFRSPLFALLPKSHPLANNRTITAAQARTVNWLCPDEEIRAGFPFCLRFLDSLRKGDERLSVTKIPVLSRNVISYLLGDKQYACVVLIGTVSEMRRSEAVVTVPIETDITQSIGIACRKNVPAEFTGKIAEYAASWKDWAKFAE